MFSFRNLQRFLSVLAICALSNCQNDESPSTSTGDDPNNPDNPNNPKPDLPTNSELPGAPHSYNYEGTDISVTTSEELLSAIDDAKSGDVIILSTGTFELPNRVTLNADGDKNQPIVIRAKDNRKAEVVFSSNDGAVEGFVARGKNWIIDGLAITSDCSETNHSPCEHAIHIKSGADGLLIRNNELVDFNAAIKGSGSDNKYANSVHIEHNKIFNTSVRMTNNPVTPIDINGGDGWLISKNSIYDFSKGMGSKVSYGAFLKANSSNGIFDSNLVQCEKNVSAPGARIGLSFGGGGNSPIDSPICKDSDCSHLHRHGRMVNNAISDCSDVGIYINASSDTLIDHNTLYSTTGIDVRYATSTTTIVANIFVGGDARERNDGTVVKNEVNSYLSNDSVASFADLTHVITPHELTEPTLSHDICGHERQSPFVGAIGGSKDKQDSCVSDISILSK